MNPLARFLTRDFAECLQPAFPLAVERMNWSALGGADSAVLVGSAGGWACEDWILDWLRRPVIIHSSAGQPLWWGYTARIEARQGQMNAVYDLDRMANRAAVCYNRRVPELDWTGTPQRTAWAEEARSAGLYGQKERLLRLDSIEEAGALLARDSALARDAFPRAVPGAEGLDAGAQVQLRITCRGWWQTIGWRYYENQQGIEGYAQAGSLAAPLGNTSANTALGQSFQSAYGSAWLLGGVDCLVRLSSAALADNLLLTVRADNAGLPGTALAASSIAAALLRGGRWWARFQLTTPLAIADATPYWVCLSRSGALNAADYYLWSREDANPYSAGSAARFDGTTWTAQPSSDYACVTSGLVPRAERIQRLLANSAGGQFLTGLVLRSQPNGYSPLYRDGLHTCLEELRHEFDLGDSSAPTLLAQVRVDRSLEISAEPLPGSEELVIKPDGGIYDLSGQRVEEGGSVVGRRARFAAGWLGESSLIQRAEWTPAGGLRVVLGD